MQDFIAGRKKATEPKKLLGIICLTFFLCLNVGLLGTGSAGILHLGFPLSCFVTAVVLFWCWPSSYIGFTMWIWFLSPLFRRLVDYRSTFVDPSPILLAPVGVTAIAALSVLPKLDRGWVSRFLPHSLFLAALILGFAEGFFLNRKVEVLEGFVLIAAPILWGVYIRGNDDATFRFKAVEKHLIVGVLVMGLYGIAQFLTSPPWDVAWLKNLGDAGSSFGSGNSIRVWSTLNSPGMFATVMAAGLILIYRRFTTFRVVAAMPGLVAVVLSLVRASWLGIAAGLILISLWDKKKRLQFLVVACIGGLLLIPVAMVPQFQDVIRDRLNTFSNISEDGSVSDRSRLYKQLLPYLAENPLGTGLSSPTHSSFKGMALDTGVLRMPLMFGWAGAALCYLALGQMLILCFRRKAPGTAHLGFRALYVVFLFLSFAGDTTTGVLGILLWTAGSACIPDVRRKESEFAFARTAMLPGQTVA